MFALLVISLLSGLLVPVYTDEVAWRFQLSRYFQDAGIDYATGETCGANTAARPALFMLPVRMFSSTLTAIFDDPMWVRLAGVGFAILALFGVRAIVRRAAPGRSAPIEMIAWSLLGLGVLPYLLVWSRPEQPVLLALLGAMLLALQPREHRDREARWPAILIVMLFAIALSYHLKALFYLPAFIVALGLTGVGAREWRTRGIAVAAMLVLAAVASSYWSARFSCPDDPLIAAKIRGENASTLITSGDWQTLWNAVPQLMRNALPELYIRSALPAPGYMSSWLPGAGLPFGRLATWHTAGWAAWMVGIAIGVTALVLAITETARRWPPLVLSLTLVICATGGATLQLNKNSYESAIYLPVITLAVVLALAAAPDRRWLSGLGWGLAAISVASQLVLIGHYAPRLWEAEKQGGYLGGQAYSLNAWHYPRADIVAAGAKCGIAPGAERVLIDDMTYFTFSHGRAPMHRLGVLSDWNGSLSDPMAWMRDRGSPGAVLACDYMPLEMRSRAIATGKICCVRAPQ